jgi:hypothetical protein
VKRRRGWAEAATLGVALPAMLVAGYLIGRWIGRWLGLGEWTGVAGAALGAVGGFLELFRWAAKTGDG